MKKLFKAIFSSFKKEEKLRDLNSLSELQIGDYISLNDSFAIPKELKGETFQVDSIDSYYYGGVLSVEWGLKGSSKKTFFLSLKDFGDEDCIVLSRQLKKDEVDELFGWNNLRAQFDESLVESLKCKSTALLDGWLSGSYERRECGGKGLYFSGDFRGKAAPNGGDSMVYHEFYADDEMYSVDAEVWSKSEIDVFVSVVRPESDVREFWAKQRA